MYRIVLGVKKTWNTRVESPCVEDDVTVRHEPENAENVEAKKGMHAEGCYASSRLAHCSSFSIISYTQHRFIGGHPLCGGTCRGRRGSGAST